MEELQGQHTILMDCVEQLRDIEASRENLVSHLREALQEQVGFPSHHSFKAFFSIPFSSFFPLFVCDVAWFCYQEFKLDQVRNQLHVTLLTLVFVLLSWSTITLC